MSPLRFASYVRYKTRTDSTTLTDSDMLMLMNIHKDNFATEIIKANENYFGVPYKQNLVANQREYPLPSDMLNQIKYLELSFDNATSYINPLPFDLNSTTYGRTTDEATITSLFSNNQDECFYEIFRGSLWIYSGTIPSSTNGIKLWSFEWPADFSDLTLTSDMSADPDNTNAGFPRPFHELLARRVIIDYKDSKDKPVPLTASEQNFDKDFQSKVNSISGADLDRANVAMFPQAQKRGDNGYNY